MESGMLDIATSKGVRFASELTETASEQTFVRIIGWFCSDWPSELNLNKFLFRFFFGFVRIGHPNKKWVCHLKTTFLRVLLFRLLIWIYCLMRV